METMFWSIGFQKLLIDARLIGEFELKQLLILDHFEFSKFKANRIEFDTDKFTYY